MGRGGGAVGETCGIEQRRTVCLGIFYGIKSWFKAWAGDELWFILTTTEQSDDSGRLH